MLEHPATHGVRGHAQKSADHRRVRPERRLSKVT